MSAIAKKGILTAEEKFFQKLECAPANEFRKTEAAWVRLITLAEESSAEEFSMLAYHFITTSASLFATFNEEPSLDGMSLLTRFLGNRKNISKSAAQYLLAVTHAFSEYRLHPVEKHMDIFWRGKSPMTASAFAFLASALPVILQHGFSVDGNNYYFDTAQIGDEKIDAQKGSAARLMNYMLLAEEDTFFNFSLGIYQRTLELEQLLAGDVDYSFLRVKIENLLHDRNKTTVSRIIELYNFIDAANDPKLSEINANILTLLQTQDVAEFERSLQCSVLNSIGISGLDLSEEDITNKIAACVINVPSEPNPENQKLLYLGLLRFSREENLIALIYKLMDHICCIVAKHPKVVLGHDQHHGLSQLLDKANSLLFEHQRSAIDRLVILCEMVAALDKGHGDLSKVKHFLHKEIFAQYPSLTPTHLTDKGFRKSLVYRHLNAHNLPSHVADKAIRAVRDVIPFTVVSKHLKEHVHADVTLREKVVNWFLKIIHRHQINKTLKDNGFENEAEPTRGIKLCDLDTATPYTLRVI